MAEKHSASPTSHDTFFHGLGHEDQFPPPSLSGRYRLSEATFAAMGRKEEDAPKAVISSTAVRCERTASL